VLKTAGYDEIPDPARTAPVEIRTRDGGDMSFE